MRPLNINATAELPYSVNIWGSHPDAGNDDCITGENYATNEAACAVFMATAHEAQSGIVTDANRAYFANWQYVEIDGPDVYLVAKNPHYDAKRIARAEAAIEALERSERATQAGMAFGCDGYNEAMGY